MKKFLTIVGILVILVLVCLGVSSVIANEKTDVAADCLRGNQSACALFQAQENLAAEKLQLQEMQITLQGAQATLQVAKEAYKASLETQTGGE